jgi:hypothetical protein
MEYHTCDFVSGFQTRVRTTKSLVVSARPAITSFTNTERTSICARNTQTVSDAGVKNKVGELPCDALRFLGNLRNVIPAHNEIKVSNPVKGLPRSSPRNERGIGDTT